MRVHRVNHPANFCRGHLHAAFYGQDHTLWEKKMGFVMCAAFIAGTFFGCLVMGLLSGAAR